MGRSLHSLTHLQSNPISMTLRLSPMLRQPTVKNEECHPSPSGENLKTRKMQLFLFPPLPLPPRPPILPCRASSSYPTTATLGDLLVPAQGRRGDPSPLPKRPNFLGSSELR